MRAIDWSAIIRILSVSTHLVVLLFRMTVVSLGRVKSKCDYPFHTVESSVGPWKTAVSNCSSAINGDVVVGTGRATFGAIAEERSFPRILNQLQLSGFSRYRLDGWNSGEADMQVVAVIPPLLSSTRKLGREGLKRRGT